jgi:hypothetical protein
MPAVSFTVDTGRIDAHLEAIGPDVEAALLGALKPLASSIADEARSAAASHIRFLGKKPGQYLASIYGDTFARDGGQGRIVGGFVRSGSPLAHLLEHGAHTPPHEILPSAAEVLAFNGDAGEVFAKAVHHPGATIPAYPAIEPVLSSRQGDVEAVIERAVKDAITWP